MQRGESGNVNLLVQVHQKGDNDGHVQTQSSTK